MSESIAERCADCREARAEFCEDCCAMCEGVCEKGVTCEVWAVGPGGYKDVYGVDDADRVDVVDGVEVSAPLDAAEKGDLERCEGVIRENLRGAIDVCMALAEIRSKRLYRERFGTFEQYCQEVWELSKVHVNRKIKLAHVYRLIEMEPMGSKPENERQIRALADLEPRQIVEVWSKAVENAPNGKVTGRVVEEAVKEVTGKPDKPEKEDLGSRKLMSREFKAAAEAFVKQVYQEASDGWENTSKRAVLTVLKTAKEMVKG